MKRSQNRKLCKISVRQLPVHLIVKLAGLAMNNQYYSEVSGLLSSSCTECQQGLERTDHCVCLGVRCEFNNAFSGSSLTGTVFCFTAAGCVTVYNGS